MTKLIIYLISYVFVLFFGFIILRYLVPYEYQKFSKLSHLTTIIQALLFFIYGGFPYVYLDNSWPEVSVTQFFHVIGILFIFAGLGSLFYGMVKLGVIRSIGQGRSQLVKSGIYSNTRNPQAIACGVYVIGFFVLWPSWYAAGWVLLYFILIQMMVLSEEKHLSRVYGQEYEMYCKNVPRYLGKFTKAKSEPA